MTCCAFALFVIGQIVAGLVALRRRVPFRLLGPPDEGPAINPATAWQLYGAPPNAAAIALSRKRGWLKFGPALGVIVALEIALVAAGAGWALSRPQPSNAAPAADPTWCLSPTSILHMATLGDREPAVAALWSTGDNP